MFSCSSSSHYCPQTHYGDIQEAWQTCWYPFVDSIQLQCGDHDFICMNTDKYTNTASGQWSHPHSHQLMPAALPKTLRGLPSFTFSPGKDLLIYKYTTYIPAGRQGTPWIGHQAIPERTQRQTTTHTHGQFRLMNLPKLVFGLWEETGITGENPRMENMQTN